MQIPATDLITGHIFQLRRGELAPRWLVVSVPKDSTKYAVPLDDTSTGYAEPLFELVDGSGNVILTTL